MSMVTTNKMDLYMTIDQSQAALETQRSSLHGTHWHLVHTKPRSLDTILVISQLI